MEIPHCLGLIGLLGSQLAKKGAGFRASDQDARPEKRKWAEGEAGGHRVAVKELNLNYHNMNIYICIYI